MDEDPLLISASCLDNSYDHFHELSRIDRFDDVIKESCCKCPFPIPTLGRTR